MISNNDESLIGGYRCRQFNIKSKDEFQQISNLISNHLSEPYSIYVYWYFLNNWPQYTYVLLDQTDKGNDQEPLELLELQECDNNEQVIGVIISKVEPHREVRSRGYIGMLVIDPKYRNKGLASGLVEMTINKMKQENVDEIMLETEVINKGALNLYESFGFLRTKRLYKYYLSTHDAFRLILPLSDKAHTRIAFLPPL